MPELDEYTGMFKNKFAILSGIRSDFSPSGVAFTVGNGEIVPSVSHLSLQFEEIQIVTKEDYGGSSKNLENTLVDAGSDFVDSFGNLFGLGKD